MKLNKLFKKYDSLKKKLDDKSNEIRTKYRDLPPSALLSIMQTKLSEESNKLSKVSFKIHKSLYESR